MSHRTVFARATPSRPLPMFATSTIAPRVEAARCGPVSLMAALLRLVDGFGPALPRKNILLIGAGETMGLAAAQAAAAHPAWRITVASSDRARAVGLAAPLGGRVMALDRLSDRLAEFDVVIACTPSRASEAAPATGSGHSPLIDADTARRALARREHRPMLMVDLAMPGNIATDADQLAGLTVHRLDDLLRPLHAAALRAAGDGAGHSYDQ